MAERVGFEPTDVFTSPVFKTGSFNRSDISPFLKQSPHFKRKNYIIIRIKCLSTEFLKKHNILNVKKCKNGLAK